MKNWVDKTAEEILADMVHLHKQANAARPEMGKVEVFVYQVAPGVWRFDISDSIGLLVSQQSPAFTEQSAWDAAAWHLQNLYGTTSKREPSLT